MNIVARFVFLVKKVAKDVKSLTFVVWLLTF